ncbi:hypothetical protein GCM10023168_11660 [Fodinibacter luteus]|uniref:DegV family protein with EDD domain n=1 Tax=Fodinibacter luteus TaxID=552064 RepID=A0ABP8K770_9MICO
MSTALVTDSTAYLPADLLAGLDVRVVPLHVVVGGREHAEGVDIDAAGVAAALRSFIPVSTSRPAPAAFLSAYEAAAAGGADAVVSVHISAEMSSTIGGAELAAAQSPLPVTVVDSRALGMAMGYAVLAGARLAAGGATAREVAEAVRATCAGATVVFYVDTLEYLRRGGRIGKAGALVGSALSIKPILGLRDGHIVPLERVRTSSRAIARLEDLAVEAVEAAGRRATRGTRSRGHGSGGDGSGGDGSGDDGSRGDGSRGDGSPGDGSRGEGWLGVDVAVQHLDSSDRAERLAERLRARIGDRGAVRVVELGAVVGAHVGPGTLAVAVVPRVAPRVVPPDVGGSPTGTAGDTGDAGTAR